MSRKHEYLRDPAAIYARSFELIEAECREKLAALPASLRAVAVRLVHACGDPSVLDDLAWRGEPVAAAKAALRAGEPVLCDARMVAEGITAAKLPAANRVVCTLNAPAVPALAASLGTTRSAAALELWPGDLGNAVVAIGNAPTALFHLLERLHGWDERPAVILGFPVGFVGAAESKEALLADDLGIPCLTLRGRRGGSALAAAAVNAIAAGNEA